VFTTGRHVRFLCLHQRKQDGTSNSADRNSGLICCINELSSPRTQFQRMELFLHVAVSRPRVLTLFWCWFYFIHPSFPSDAPSFRKWGGGVGAVSFIVLWQLYHRQGRDPLYYPSLQQSPAGRPVTTPRVAPCCIHNPHFSSS